MREIRRRYVRYARRNHPDSADSLAAEFGVDKSTICRAARGETWTVV